MKTISFGYRSDNSAELEKFCDELPQVKEFDELVKKRVEEILSQEKVIELARELETASNEVSEINLRINELEEKRKELRTRMQNIGNLLESAIPGLTGHNRYMYTMKELTSTLDSIVRYDTKEAFDPNEKLLSITNELISLASLSVLHASSETDCKKAIKKLNEVFVKLDIDCKVVYQNRTDSKLDQLLAEVSG